MKRHHSVYDWQEALDPRCIMALAKMGIHASRIIGQPGRLKGCKFNFTFEGDTEQAKYTVDTFLRDEYGATLVKFWCNPNDRTQVYATFDYNERMTHREKSN